MKSLREYITESEQWIDSPAAGDDFAINIREDVLLETYILEADDDRIVLASDDDLVTVLEEYGMLDELSGLAEGEDARGLDHAYEVHGNRHGYYVWRKSPISAILNIGITDPRLTGLTSWDPRSPGIQDYVNQHMKSVNFNSLSDDIKELIKTKLPLQQGKPEKSDSPPALSGTDKTQSPNQNLDRFRKLAGLAEEREDREWSKRELEVLNKAERDFKRHLDSVSTPDDRAFNANLVKKRMAKNPLTGPKGQLPEQQGVAEGYQDDVSEAEYRGRKVPLGKPMAGDVKKRKVYVRKPNGNVVKVEFGDKTMRIKKSNPKRRKSFRARHNCANPGPRWKARYWSCRAW